MATVQVTVTTMGAEVVWGPEASLPCTEPVATLKRAVAEKMHAEVEEVMLTLGELELKNEVSLAEAGVTEGAQLQAVRIDPWSEPAELALQRLLSTAVKGAHLHSRELTFNLEAEIPDVESSTWLAGIAKMCGCEENGLPRDVKAMLEAIHKCRKSFGQGYAAISIPFLGKNEISGPGLLCLSAHNTEWGYLVTFVDLTGAMAEIYGACGAEYKGAVWKFACGDDDWGDLNKYYAIGLSSQHTIEKWAKVIKICRETNCRFVLPFPVSPSMESFFSKWGADGSCPVSVPEEHVFEGTDEATFRIPEVVAFKQRTAQIFEEKMREANFATQQSLLTQIFAFLDAEGKGHLSCYDLIPLWEVGGRLTSDCNASNLYQMLITLCKDNGFETTDGISESAFLACLMLMPLSGDTDQYYQVENGMINHFALKDYVKTLRAGTHSNGHYLGPLKRDKILHKALVREMFNLLDKDGNGYISSSELRPLVELFQVYHPGGWDPALPYPWGDGFGHPRSESFTEESTMEQWVRQFKDLCEARALPADTGFSESSFATYVEEMNTYHTELAWGVEMVRLGPPPGGHYMHYVEWMSTNTMIRPGVPQLDSDPAHYEDASAVAQEQGMVGSSFQAVYEWALQGSPRLLTCSIEGVNYTLTSIPDRRGLLDDWNLVERAPRQHEWTLEPNE